MTLRETVKSLYSTDPEIAALQLEKNKLQTKAFKTFPGSPKQKAIIKQIDELNTLINNHKN